MQNDKYETAVKSFGCDISSVGTLIFLHMEIRIACMNNKKKKNRIMLKSTLLVIL